VYDSQPLVALDKSIWQMRTVNVNVDGFAIDCFAIMFGVTNGA